RAAHLGPGHARRVRLRRRRRPRACPEERSADAVHLRRRRHPRPRRVPPGARRWQGVARDRPRGRDRGAADRLTVRRHRRLLRRGHRLARLPVHGDDHGVPADLLPRLRERQAGPVSDADRLGTGLPARCLRRSLAHRRLHVLLPDAARPGGADSAQARRVRRRGADGGRLRLANPAQASASVSRPDADHLGGDRDGDEHPARGRAQLRRCRRSARDPDLGVASLDHLGHDLPAAVVQPAERHGLADRVPDGVHPDHRRLAQPTRRRDPPRNRSGGRAVKRFLTFMLRRTLRGLFTIWAIVTITFFVFEAIPNEPASYIYPLAQHLNDYQIKHAHHLLGTDKPLLTQYGDYLWHLLQGDFGKQWEGALLIQNTSLQQQPIAPQLEQWLPVTLSIVLGGAVLVVLLSVPLGAIAGRRIGSMSDRTISLIALVGICTHPMVIGLILRGIFGDHLHWAPSGTYCPITGPGGPSSSIPLGPGQSVPGSAGGCGGVVDWA